ncbi:sulfur carrier protein ThiS [Leekyejoonella antrihumi]|uniref:Sulfur carrier protein ThiS n=1 Tax=Leekyejoonella antrihumi TaxID=1660198 RepID=A0A563E1F4_9MICO|nr:sulfur carrier protein ThiS [Leekyejoonella antrihumi]TWP36347.1 sulfur carrier protein ThiS [Leekyejoonella antrihumi]
MTITATLNGTPQTYEPGTTVAALVEEHGWREQAVAVAVDGALVPKSRWQHAEIADGSDIITLSPMQGG